MILIPPVLKLTVSTVITGYQTYETYRYLKPKIESMFHFSEEPDYFADNPLKEYEKILSRIK